MDEMSERDLDLYRDAVEFDGERGVVFGRVLCPPDEQAVGA